MKVYIIIETGTHGRDCIYGVFASRESASNWIDNQPWLSEVDKEFLIIIEEELRVE
jgi:hypothetical protein